MNPNAGAIQESTKNTVVYTVVEEEEEEKDGIERSIMTSSYERRFCHCRG